jgi:hypothetical protein
LALFLFQFFDDELGPLGERGLLQGTVQQAADLAAVCGPFPAVSKIDEVIGAIRPYIAGLHFAQMLVELESEAAPLKEALKDAAELIGGQPTLADCGGDETVSSSITDGLKEVIEDVEIQSNIEAIVAKLQEMAELAGVEAGGKVNGGRMLASAMVTERLDLLPARFLIAIGWCSDATLAQFTGVGMYVHAFDLILKIAGVQLFMLSNHANKRPSWEGNGD